MLPPDFSFSQQNLQDYLDCKRRFYLRYIEHLEWPAIESEPVLEQEKLMELGHAFHVLVQQSLSGIPAESIQATLQDEELQRWWDNFQALELYLADKKYYVEEMLSIPFSSFRLIAKVDLIIVQADQSILIYDWKTSMRVPNREAFIRRAQSKVYPYVVTQASQTLTQSDPVDPENIKMIYWFPEHPLLPIEMEYSAAKLEKDEKELSRLVTEINSMDGREEFPKTDNLRLCEYCAYRSFCGRGSSAGSSDEEVLSPSGTDENPFDIDFESL